MVFSVNYFCRFRQLFLPVHPLFLTALLGHSGAVAGHVEFQDDRVVDHPVSRAFAKRPTGRRDLERSASDREAAEGVASGIRDAKADNTRRAYSKGWPLSRPGRRPTAISTCPLHHRPSPSTSAAWRRTSRPWPPSSRPGLPSPTYTPPPTCRRMTIPPATCHSGHRLELPGGTPPP